MQTWTGGASIAFVLKRGYLERTYTLTIKSTGTVLYFQDVSWEKYDLFNYEYEGP